MMMKMDEEVLALRKPTPGGELVVKVHGAFSDTRRHFEDIIADLTRERDAARGELAEVHERLAQLLDEIRKYGPPTVVQG